MTPKPEIKFMAYDDDLTDYVEIPELTQHFNEAGLPRDNEVVFNAVSGESFKVEKIRSKIVDWTTALQITIFAQPL